MSSSSTASGPGSASPPVTRDAVLLALNTLSKNFTPEETDVANAFDPFTMSKDFLRWLLDTFGIAVAFDDAAAADEVLEAITKTLSSYVLLLLQKVVVPGMRFENKDKIKGRLALMAADAIEAASAAPSPTPEQPLPDGGTDGGEAHPTYVRAERGNTTRLSSAEVSAALAQGIIEQLAALASTSLEEFSSKWAEVTALVVEDSASHMLVLKALILLATSASKADVDLNKRDPERNKLNMMTGAIEDALITVACNSLMGMSGAGANRRKLLSDEAASMVAAVVSLAEKTLDKLYEFSTFKHVFEAKKKNADLSPPELEDALANYLTLVQIVFGEGRAGVDVLNAGLAYIKDMTALNDKAAAYPGGSYAIFTDVIKPSTITWMKDTLHRIKRGPDATMATPTLSIYLSADYIKTNQPGMLFLWEQTNANLRSLACRGIQVFDVKSPAALKTIMDKGDTPIKKEKESTAAPTLKKKAAVAANVFAESELLSKWERELRMGKIDNNICLHEAIGKCADGHCKKRHSRSAVPHHRIERFLRSRGVADGIKGSGSFKSIRPEFAKIIDGAAGRNVRARKSA